AADAVLAAHLGFVPFVVCGGWLVLRRPALAWLHVPAVAWAAFVEFSGWICPLTPLEVALRQGAGEAGYGGDFVEHYLVALIYPSGLTRELQVLAGAIVLLVNLAIYGILWRRRFRR
ncbi:MAG: DUF2784 domain-containing protein, partial [Casimicrobiaceae bacterium]